MAREPKFGNRNTRKHLIEHKLVEQKAEQFLSSPRMIFNIIAKGPICL